MSEELIMKVEIAKKDNKEILMDIIIKFIPLVKKYSRILGADIVM